MLPDFFVGRCVRRGGEKGGAFPDLSGVSCKPAVECVILYAQRYMLPLRVNTCFVCLHGRQGLCLFFVVKKP